MDRPHRAEVVDIDLPLVVFDRRLHDELRNRQTGVTDEHVDGTERLLRLGDPVFEFGFRGVRDDNLDPRVRELVKQLLLCLDEVLLVTG